MPAFLLMPRPPTTKTSPRARARAPKRPAPDRRTRETLRPSNQDLEECVGQHSEAFRKSEALKQAIIDGRPYPVRCQVRSISGFSAHADESVADVILK